MAWKKWVRKTCKDHYVGLATNAVLQLVSFVIFGFIGLFIAYVQEDSVARFFGFPALGVIAAYCGFGLTDRYKRFKKPPPPFKCSSDMARNLQDAIFDVENLVTSGKQPAKIKSDIERKSLLRTHKRIFEEFEFFSEYNQFMEYAKQSASMDNILNRYAETLNYMHDAGHLLRQELQKCYPRK